MTGDGADGATSVGLVSQRMTRSMCPRAGKTMRKGAATAAGMGMPAAGRRGDYHRGKKSSWKSEMETIQSQS